MEKTFFQSYVFQGEIAKWEKGKIKRMDLILFTYILWPPITVQGFSAIIIYEYKKHFNWFMLCSEDHYLVSLFLVLAHFFTCTQG